jgi:uncharacterized membrane protein
MLLDSYIQQLGDIIAYIGVFVVLIGVLITIGRLIHFFATGFNEEYSKKLRHALMVYLSLGLDFLIAKDVILTLLLEEGDYRSIIQLAVVIVIRILLSYFVHLEEGSLHGFVPAKKVKKKR